MHIAFWYQYGKIDGIGMGHKYRSHILGGILKERGHEVLYIEDDVILTGPDILVIDHMNPPKNVAKRAVHFGMKIVVLDGKESLADISISPFSNDDADYKGFKYIVFPKLDYINKYDVNKENNTVFVGMGGYDRNNYAELVLSVLDKIGVNAIVAKSINHVGFRKYSSRVEMFCEENYYDAMKECIMAVTNGGLTLFQALHFGIPTVALAQYDHQDINIRAVEYCCVHTYPDEQNLEVSIRSVLDNEYYRRNLSDLARHHIDGKGAARVCDIIEGLKQCR